ncbi:MAG: capsular polysaccharide biosynthesis protein [Lachnospiraceae bacterium]|nr:capsular polysaccharide biosynthesis protein [Lachnospiraceae bacterium]
MIDFHSHVLPGIDDGSRNPEMSRMMFYEAARQGVEVMAATPHFYGDRDTIDRFLKRRESAWEKALPLAEEAGIELVAGAEVAYFDNMSQAGGIEALTLADTEILLVEMPFRAWSRREIQELDRLLHEGFRLMLAHLERYLGFQKDKGILEAIYERPIFVQLNAESLLGFWNGQKALKLFKEGRAHLLGSDCHNLTSRPPNLAEGRAVIEKKLGRGKLAEIDKLGERLLEQVSFGG